jgi:hypothetical protein
VSQLYLDTDVSKTKMHLDTPESRENCDSYFRTEVVYICISLLQDPHAMMHIILIVFTIFLNINEITHCRASVQFSHCSISSPLPPSHEHKTMHYVYSVQRKSCQSLASVYLGCYV